MNEGIDFEKCLSVNCRLGAPDIIFTCFGAFWLLANLKILTKERHWARPLVWARVNISTKFSNFALHLKLRWWRVAGRWILSWMLSLMLKTFYMNLIIIFLHLSEQNWISYNKLKLEYNLNWIMNLVKVPTKVWLSLCTPTHEVDCSRKMASHQKWRGSKHKLMLPQMFSMRSVLSWKVSAVRCIVVFLMVLHTPH